MLGIAALAFGLSILAFNFTMEYAAFDGETPLTELPSFQSLLRRTGSDSGFNAAYADELSWGPFLEGQFQRILRMFIPYSLLGPLSDLDDIGAADESPTWLSKGLAVFLGVVLSAACLIGLIFVRPRILFATLASFGFFWALPMRHNTYHHDFESIYYIGIPLVLFSLILMYVHKRAGFKRSSIESSGRRKAGRGKGARRRQRSRREIAVPVTAVLSIAAVLLFTVSSFHMSRVGHSAETARAARSAQQELLDIRKTTAGEPVTVLNAKTSTQDFFAWLHAGHAMDYYLNSSPIQYAYLPAVEGGFVVTRERLDTDALLTPQNEYFFLYDRAGLEGWFESMYRSVASGEPVGREEFDVYFDDRTMYYLKEPCEREERTAVAEPSFFLQTDAPPDVDTDLRFFLHVGPEDENDLPDDRRQYGFNNLDFIFVEHGVLFDGKCLARVVLPRYDVSTIVTGRLYGDWGVVHHVDSMR